jgi:hypothetical protein
MTETTVRARRTLSDFLVTIKQVDQDPHELETPFRPIPMKLLDSGEEIHEDARGIAEIHIELSSSDFELLAAGKYSILDNLSSQLNTIGEDVLTVAVVEYTGRRLLGTTEIEALVRTVSEEFDIISSLLMSEQLDKSNLDVNPESYDRFVENQERFLGAVDSVEAETPVLGVTPVISRHRIKELLEIYIERGVEGICVDFLGKKPTAKNRAKYELAPLMEELGSHQLYRTSIMYALNAYRGNNRSDSDSSPAEDFYAFGLGFDFIGGQYYRPSPTYVPADYEPKFRVFHEESYEQEYVSLDVLSNKLPEQTALETDHIMHLAGGDDNRGRIQTLLEFEQMNLAFNELRTQIQDGCTAEFITEKDGTTENVRSAMETVRTAYDEGASEPSLASF